MAQAQQKESDESLQVLPTQCERWLQAFFCCLSAYQFEFDAIFPIYPPKKTCHAVVSWHLLTDQSTVSLSLRALHQLAAVPHEAPWMGPGPWAASKHVTTLDFHVLTITVTHLLS